MKQGTNMRIIFGASSSETHFPSLNDSLSPGLNLTPNFLKFFIFMFPLNKIAVTARWLGRCISENSYASEEREAVQILWFTEDLNLEPEVLRMTCVIFGTR